MESVSEIVGDQNQGESTEQCSESENQEFKCRIFTKHAQDQEDTVNFIISKNPNFVAAESLAECDIYWIFKSFKMKDLSTLIQNQVIINKIHGVHIFKSKVIQSIIYEQCAKYYPDEYYFYSKTYIMPKDNEKLINDMDECTDKSQKWICKISQGLMGEGISLFSTVDELKKLNIKDERIVQEYIDNPFLLNKKKWDFRLYLVITGVNPMNAYLSTEHGVCRFCTDDYDSSNLGNLYANVTNTAINKFNEKYQSDSSDAQNLEEEIKFSSRMGMNTVWRLIKKLHPDIDIEKIKEKIRKACRNTIKAFRPAIEAKLGEMFDISLYPSVNSQCYHVLGVDLMIDSNLNVHIFEINRFPKQVPYVDKELETGEKIFTRSCSNEENLTNIYRELYKILLTGKESTIMQKVYDSEESDCNEFIYEKVYKVYRKL